MRAPYSRCRGTTPADRFTRIKTTMPAPKPGSLDDQTVVDLIAYILQVNGYPAGETEIPTDPAELEQIAIPSN